MFCLHVCKVHMCVPGVLVDQKTGLKPLKLELGAAMCWEQNPGPLQEQQVLITIFPAPVVPSETHLHPVPRLLSRIPTQETWGETWTFS